MGILDKLKRPAPSPPDEMSRKRAVHLMLYFVCWIPPLLFPALSLSSMGCAIQYYDSKSGTEHIWGFGHMAMKPSAPVEGLKMTAYRTDVMGITIGRLREGVHFGMGWVGSQRIEVVDENTRLCLGWPHGSFYKARVGSEFPPKLEACGSARREEVP